MSCDGFHDASNITTLFAVSRLMPSPPAFVDIRNSLSLSRVHNSMLKYQISVFVQAITIATHRMHGALTFVENCVLFLTVCRNCNGRDKKTEKKPGSRS